MEIWGSGGRVLALVIVSFIFGVASQAQAADRFDPVNPPYLKPTSDQSSQGRAVMLGNGTVALVWRSGAGVLSFCRIGPAATGCDSPPQVLENNSAEASAGLLQPDPTEDPDTLRAVYGTTGAGSLFVRTSTDGGQTFAPRAQATSGQRAGVFAHGPGAFQFTDLNGGYLQVGQYEPSSVNSNRLQLVSEQFPGFSGLAASDSTTAISVFQIGSGDNRPVVSRRYDSSGSVNDASSWTTAKRYQPPKGIQSVVDLVGGPRGVFIGFLEWDKTGCGSRFVVARYGGQDFGAPVPVDKEEHPLVPGKVTSCFSGDTISFGAPVALGQDPAGNLRAVWTYHSGAGDSTPDGMYHSVSVDGGQTWSNPMRLYSGSGPEQGLQAEQTGPAIVGNANGAAVLVLEHFGGSGVRLVRLPSISAALAQPGDPTPSCRATVAFGAVKAMSTVGCFKRNGKTWVTSGPVRVNGIDLIPSSSTSAAATSSAKADPHSDSPAKLTFDTAANTIVSTGSWRARASAVELGRQPVRWFVPAGGGQVLDAKTREPVRLDASKPKQRVLGLPATGVVMPKLLKNGTAKLPMNLQLPAPLGGIVGGPLTDDVELTTDNAAGIRLDKGRVRIALPEVSLGMASISPFAVTYDADPFTFQGDLGITLPVVGGEIDGHFVITNGEFVDATANYSPPAPGIPIAGFAYLTRVGLNVHKGQSCTDATAIEVNGDLSAGPKILGASLASVTGAARYSLPEGSCNRPGVFRIDGTGKIVGLEVGQVYVQFVTDGTLTFGASIVLGTESNGLSGSVDGGIAFDSGEFYARGEVAVTVLNYDAASVEAVVGSVGIGACARLQLIPIPIPIIPELPTRINAGAKYRWGEGLTVYPLNCNVSDLIPARFNNASKASVLEVDPGTPTVSVKAGTPVQTFVARGADQAPRYALVSPHGERYETPEPERGLSKLADGVLALTDDGLKQASITVEKPEAGQWSLEELSGSVDITSAEGAAGGPAPKLKASVRRIKGRKFRLKYSAKIPAGAKLTFLEQGGKRIAAVRHSGKGSREFRAADGAAGKRKVVALVESEAGPMAGPVVAKFTAPGPITPGRPKRVSLRRSKGKHPGLRVSWRKAANADHYVVRAVLRDGRRIEKSVPRRRRGTMIPAVPGFDTATITVYGVAKNGRVGRGAVAKLKAVKKKPGKKS